MPIVPLIIFYDVSYSCKHQIVSLFGVEPNFAYLNLDVTSMYKIHIGGKNTLLVGAT